MSDTEARLRETVKKLFDEKQIDLFIGYGQGSLPPTSAPVFISGADEVDRLVWNRYCLNNLAVYLPRYFVPIPRKEEQSFPRIGVAVKGCDARSVVGLIKEHQVPRENITIVGIPCPGMVERGEVESRLPGGQITKVEKGPEEIRVSTDAGEAKTFKILDVLAESCVSCQHPVPRVYDVLLGDEKDARGPAGDEFPRLKEFEAKSIDERWKYFQEEMSRCIRCYACRNACPNCYCKLCFAEQTQPAWIGVTDDPADVVFYHLGRLFHQAGRCVDCGACARACPMGIDLRLFLRGMVRDVKELFGYEAGVSLEEPVPLATFGPDDSQEFITEP